MTRKKPFFLGLVSCLLCLLFWGQPIWAHDPHDVVQQVATSPNYSEDQTVYLLVRGNFLKSTDGGAIWQRQVKDLDHLGALTAFDIARQSPNRLYLLSNEDGVYRTDDGGESWRTVNGGLSELSLENIAISPTDENLILVAGHEGNLYRSDNGGDSWSLALSTNSPVTAVTFSGDAAQLLVGEQLGLLHRSSDQGETWSEVETFSTDSPITSVSFPDGAAVDQFWVGTAEEGIWRTLNSGQSFEAVNEGLPETAIQDIEGMVTSDNNQVVLYVSTANEGVFFSENSGDSWQSVDDGLTKTDQADKMGFPHFTDLALSSGFSEDKTLFASGFNGLFKSTDGGAGWSQLDTLPGDIVMAVAVSPDYANDKSVVAVTYVGEAYQSQDGGETWTPMAKGLELPFFTDQFAPIERNDDPRRFQALAFSPNYAKDKTVFATILNNGVLNYSQSKGWKLQRFKDWERALAITPSPNFAQDRTLFVGTQKGRVYRSDNGGKKFKKVSEIEPQFGNESPFMVVSPDYGNDKTVFMTGASGVYKSTDAGKSWQTVTDKALVEGRLKLKLAISSNYGIDQTLWLGSTNGLLKTQDGGDTWTEVAGAFGDSPYIEAVAVSPDFVNDQTVIVSVRVRG
ncbi:MAG: glycosyl hydrolase, partial [Leptolyngbya sp. SIO3F4]|nr:glycosyl hydrolase [Leptolyngbya sp. SIO3F4]